MKNATFQITPDVIKESETIQLGQDLKLSCHVDAVPQEKVVYSWYKNGKPARFSDRLLITRNDPELPPVTCSLEIIDLRFSDYGTYLCVATFQGAPIPDLSVEVNISSETGEPLCDIWGPSVHHVLHLHPTVLELRLFKQGTRLCRKKEEMAFHQISEVLLLRRE